MGALRFFSAAMIRAFKLAKSHSNGTLHEMNSNHRLTRMIFQYTKCLVPGVAIFSPHTLASPSGRNVKYDQKQLAGKKIFELFLLSVQVL
jgi:hypothetical protein